jgi:hypothetical protein
MKKLDITTKTSGDKVYKNIDLKQLQDGEYIIVEKRFVEGRVYDGKFGKSYSCAVIYEGEDVTFWLREKYTEHQRYAETGGIGDKIKVTAKEEKVVNPKTKAKILVTKFYFDKVE